MLCFPIMRQWIFVFFFLHNLIDDRWQSTNTTGTTQTCTIQMDLPIDRPHHPQFGYIIFDCMRSYTIYLKHKQRQQKRDTEWKQQIFLRNLWNYRLKQKSSAKLHWQMERTMTKKHLYVSRIWCQCLVDIMLVVTRITKFRQKKMRPQNVNISTLE